MFNAYKMDELKKALQENAREEMQSAKGKKSKADTIVKKLLKQANAYNKSFQKAHAFTFNGADYFGFCDGHVILASADDFSYSHAEDHEKLKLGDFFKDIPCVKASFDPEDVKRFEKVVRPFNKRSVQKPYVVSDDYFVGGFNPAYMAMASDFCEVDHFYYNLDCMVSGNCYKSPIYFYNEDQSKIALILPVNINQNLAGAIEFTKNYMNLAI